MRFVSALMVFSIFLVLSGNLFAQEEEELIAKDLLEVSIFGGLAIPAGGLSDWTSTSSDLGTAALGTKTGFDLGVDVGLFLTPSLSLGFDFTYSQFGIQTDSVEASSMNHRIFSPTLYLKYFFFGESNLVPYLKGGAGVDVVKYATRVKETNTNNYAYRELSYDPAFAVTAGAGFFYYTHDYGGLFFEANFHNGFTKNTKGSFHDEKFEFGEQSTLIDIHAGIIVFFGSE